VYRLDFSVALPVIHSIDLGKSASDSDLWNYSKENGLVIMTKDADFSDRIAIADPPPWVIHVRFGNVRGKSFHHFFEKHWTKIFRLLPAHKLINVITTESRHYFSIFGLASEGCLQFPNRAQQNITGAQAGVLANVLRNHDLTFLGEGGRHLVGQPYLLRISIGRPPVVLPLDVTNA